MRAVIQRVRNARVLVDDTVTGQIGEGLLVFLGVSHSDTQQQAELLANKVTKLRVFADAESKMNLSLIDIGGELLVVSQFTLYGDTRKGNRPSYSDAARPDAALPLYECFVNNCRARGIRVATGVFQAHMLVELINDGPVTLLCEASEHSDVKSWE